MTEHECMIVCEIVHDLISLILFLHAWYWRTEHNAKNGTDYQNKETKHNPVLIHIMRRISKRTDVFKLFGCSSLR